MIDVQDSIATVGELEPAVDVQIMQEAGHFLHGRLSDLRGHVHEFWQNQTSDR